MNPVELTCTVVKLYRNCPKEHGWTGFFARSRTYGNIQVTGTPKFLIEPGMNVKIKATKDEKGTFVASEFELVTMTKSAIVNYLSGSNFPGIGRTIAERIYTHYGDNSIVMLRDNLDIVIHDVGLSKRQAAAFTKTLHDPVTVIKAVFPILTVRQIQEIINKYYEKNTMPDASKIIAIIQKNPYDLIEQIKSLSFKKIDQLALETLKFAKVDPRRTRYILKFAIEKQLRDTGDNYINLSDDREYMLLIATFLELLDTKDYDLSDNGDKTAAQNWFSKILTNEIAREKSLIYIDQWIDNNYIVSHLYTARGWKAQTTIINCVHERLACQKSNFMKTLDEKNGNLNALIANANKAAIKQTGHAMSTEQTDAVRNALAEQLSVITGGPGRGKTATVCKICDIYEDICMLSNERNINRKSTILSGMRKLLLLAPTGRAAKNLSEHTHRSAYTVAKLITEMNCSNHDNICQNAANGLAIIDECSMINQNDMADLLDILVELNMQIVLVGDVNQLPPIDPGRPFKDIIDCGKVVVSKLTICFRTNIKVISDNADIVLAGGHNIAWSPDFMFLDHADDEEACSKALISSYLHELSTGLDIRKIALLCAIHKGLAGSDYLNLCLQNELNPINDMPMPKHDSRRSRNYYDDNGTEIPGTWFASNEMPNDKRKIRIGDRVMCRENDYTIARVIYQKNLYDTFVNSMGIFNGDCGTVVRYYPYKDKDHPGMVMILLDDGYSCLLELDSEQTSACKLTLAYATTVHKSQGCEYETVFMAVPTQLTKLSFISRNLLYTAVTRAKKSFCAMGSKDALYHCIDTEPLPRHSTMATRL